MPGRPVRFGLVVCTFNEISNLSTTHQGHHFDTGRENAIVETYIQVCGLFVCCRKLGRGSVEHNVNNFDSHF